MRNFIEILKSIVMIYILGVLFFGDPFPEYTHITAVAYLIFIIIILSDTAISIVKRKKSK